jgi:hypothetical protein
MGRYFNMPEAGSRWQIGQPGRFNWAVADMTGVSRLLFLYHVAKYATVVKSFANGQKQPSLVEQPLPL